MLFSGAQLHASIPNTSGDARFSVDFRTVDVADLQWAVVVLRSWTSTARAPPFATSAGSLTTRPLTRIGHRAVR